MNGGGGDHWTRYWSGGAGGGGGCLPNAAGPVEAAQKRVWQDFAARLPRRARVLDLACGSGVVGGWLVTARPDLRIVGVDSAAALPPPPKGVSLKAGVALERLPFGDASFDAATSQFGFEYADSTAAAAELARVLRPGAPVRMIVHHAESVIVAHNRARREALLWAAGPKSGLAKARAFAAAAPGLPVPPALRAGPAEARRRFPDRPIAAEIAEAVLQRLSAGRGAAGLLDALAREAEGEIARIAAMERAARSVERVEALARTLSEAGLSVDAPDVLPDVQPGRVLAWILSARR